jgi:hypothetical protein
MRTYGRVYNNDGSYKWVNVTTDANGYNDQIYVTTLCQVFRLNLGESPFYGNYGIPAQQSVIQQIAPDYYMSVTQQQFSPYFANLLVKRVAYTDSNGVSTPYYNVKVTTKQGSVLQTQVAA